MVGGDCYSAGDDECFRDACSRGDLEVVASMVAELPAPRLTALLRSTSSCTGTPLFDAVLLQQVMLENMNITWVSL